MNEINVEIKKHFGVLSRDANGWAKELNLVSWNNAPAKFEIREWSPDHRRMSRGVIMTAEEVMMLTTLLNKLMAEIDAEIEEDEDD